ncbi:unnamed protein product [Linum trigynum]|uniref:Uncharacterized protein n=1 Tax=Linum trigynum TaxID=586398 RepID=A0AAV2GSN2_9ROSI
MSESSCRSHELGHRNLITTIWNPINVVRNAHQCQNSPIVIEICSMSLESNHLSRNMLTIIGIQSQRPSESELQLPEVGQQSSESSQQSIVNQIYGMHYEICEVKYLVYH